ncbi:MAG TPA: NAD-binding protein [Bacteroidia bacterium]|nr:hypothetical protein [Sphingobacteriales bacterium]HPD64054.1 NAD-binding protein [Bacteroidia bacterium]HRS57586.1 NAD-binding protein [Bacteroidia bacterium]HRU67171.1 NAD-binding protein [Bacteroidia bacterium]
MSKTQKYVLIGMGAFGQEIAYTLKEYNAELIIIDKNADTVAQLKRDGFPFVVQLDSTDGFSLEKFVSPDDIVVLSMGESFEDNIVTVGILTRIGVKKIYTRATRIIHEEILNQMKNTITLFPEREEGKRVALKLLYKEFYLIEEISPGIFLCEMDVPESFVGQTIIELDVRNKYGINIIGLKKHSEDNEGLISSEMQVIGFEKVILEKNHILAFLANEKNMAQMLKHKF